MNGLSAPFLLCPSAAKAAHFLSIRRWCAGLHIFCLSVGGAPTAHFLSDRRCAQLHIFCSVGRLLLAAPFLLVVGLKGLQNSCSIGRGCAGAADFLLVCRQFVCVFSGEGRSESFRPPKNEIILSSKKNLRFPIFFEDRIISAKEE